MFESVYSIIKWDRIMPVYSSGSDLCPEQVQCISKEA